MRFLPGSHLEIVRHRDTFHRDNLLTRGQEVDEEVDEDKAVEVVLTPGQMSLHHGRLFHASHANQSADRRIGLAIRYINPAMKQAVGEKAACLVRGEDPFGHFELVNPPQTEFDPEDIKRWHRLSKNEESFLYRDTDV